MAKLIKRIVEAQKNNVVISDLNITLRNKNDRLDLLERDSFGRQKRTLQQITKSRDLDTLLGEGSLLLYDENGNLLSGYSPVKSADLASARREESTSLKGATTTYVIGDGLKVDPGSVLRLNFDNNGISTIPSRTDHTHLASDITDFSEAVDDKVSNLLTNSEYISWTYSDEAGSIVGTTNLSQFSTSDLIEGSNLYYTQSRFNTAFNFKSTDDLKEGDNLYYTDERVDSRVSSLFINNDYISWTYNNILGSIVGVTNLSQFSTSDLIEGSNLYYTQSRFDFSWNEKLSGNSIEYLDGSGNWTSPCLLLTQNFTNKTTVNVFHNFGKNPLVQIVVNNEVFIPVSIIHNTLNDFTVKFSSPKTGKVLAMFGTY